MNFDDRLRNHLHDQTEDITFTNDGVDGVRSRSRRRKQRRAGAATLSVAVLAIVGALTVFGPNNEKANLATDGDATIATETTVADAPTEAASTQPTEIALPEPGSALALSTANNADAPGGYNVFQSGRANNVYFVVSTAPGTTYDGTNVDYVRPNTLYTFDGSDWTQNELGDRFVSSFDNPSNGVLYAVSTGSPTSRELAVGQSTDGLTWEWTPLNLSAVFGDDESTWPAYAVQQATAGDQRLVIVASSGEPNYETAFTLAKAAGADIVSSDQIANVSSDGISWFETTEVTACEAADNNRLNELWDNEPEGPEIDFERELTPEERAELEAIWTERDARSNQLRLEALEAAAAVDGCDEYVECMTELTARSAASEARIVELLSSFGQSRYSSEGLDDAQMAALNAEYQIISKDQEEWMASSDCADALGWLAESEEPSLSSSTWAELGVEVPSSWTPAQYGFLIDGGSVTDLGVLFPGQTGYLVDVAESNGRWTVTFDSTDYATFETEGATGKTEFVAWTSTNGLTWSSEPTNWSYGPEQQSLDNGVSLAVSWAEEESQLIRRNPDGTTNALRLADLAPDVDTTGYSLARVATGEYGVVVTAVNWTQLENGGNYDSIVLYSPDGSGWGATVVPDVEVVDAIVGSEDVVLFLNDPNREPGTPQPILLGK